jgi:anthranilate/para-aminobenzoate synthase component II
MLLMIDNYDSFTYNLVQYFRALGAQVITVRNDAANLQDLEQLQPSHSLAIERASLPESLSVTAQTEDGEIMGVRHRELPIEGVQFHPESIDTEHGMAMLDRFLKH